MGVITEDMKQLIDARRLAHVATCSKGGVPNVSPRGSIRNVDDNTLVCGGGVEGKTYQNLKENPRIAVEVTEREIYKSFQFKGTGNVENSGDLYDMMTEDFVSRGRPAPLYVIRIAVEDVYVNPPGSKVEAEGGC